MTEGPDSPVVRASQQLQRQFATAVGGLADGDPQASLALFKHTSPLFLQLRQLNRTAHDDVREGKRRVGDIRTTVDEACLALQKLNYQKRHLLDEIRQCRDFQSIYQTVPVVEMDEFVQRAPPEDREADVLGDPHALQLARLRFELAERKRLEEEKRAVQAQRATLVKENKVKKRRLEGLEGDLKEMLSRSVQVRRRFEEANEEQQEDEKASATAQTQKQHTPKSSSSIVEDGQS